MVVPPRTTRGDTGGAVAVSSPSNSSTTTTSSAAAAAAAVSNNNNSKNDNNNKSATSGGMKRRTGFLITLAVLLVISALSLHREKGEIFSHYSIKELRNTAAVITPFQTPSSNRTTEQEQTMQQAQTTTITSTVAATATTTTTTTTTTTKTTMAGEGVGVGGIFFCGYENKRLAQEVFPDYVNRFAGGYDHESDVTVGFNMPKRMPTKHDVLIMGMHGPCSSPVQRFPGKVLFVNGEPNGDNMPNRIKLDGRQKVGQDVYQIGLLGNTDHSVMIFHGAWNMMRLDESVWPTLWDHARKPINSKTYNGLMYMNGKCHQHREAAVNRISSIMTIYHGGACRGQGQPMQRFQRMPNIPQGRHWTDNLGAYHEYKFCMAMENSNVRHYLSEKIIMAFLAGCIPIYYGSTEVFDVFNRQAFVFYDPQNPTPALAQIQLLYQNETAYNDMLYNQPIMANGDSTVRDYFSISDRIDGGYLKQKLRQTMGLPPQ